MSSDTTIQAGYCDCGEPHSTAKWWKTGRRWVCRRCFNPVPAPPTERKGTDG